MGAAKEHKKKSNV